MMHFNDKTNKIKPIQQKQRELSTKLIDLSRLVDMMCKKTIHLKGYSLYSFGYLKKSD